MRISSGGLGSRLRHPLAMLLLAGLFCVALTPVGTATTLSRANGASGSRLHAQRVAALLHASSHSSSSHAAPSHVASSGASPARDLDEDDASGDDSGAVGPTGDAASRSRALHPVAGGAVDARAGEQVPRLLVMRALDSAGRTIVRQTLLVDPRGLVRVPGGEAVVQGLAGDALAGRLLPVVQQRYPGAARVLARIVPGLVIQTQGSTDGRSLGFPTGPQIVPHGTTLAGLIDLLPLGRDDDPRRVTHIHDGRAQSYDLIEMVAGGSAAPRNPPLSSGDWIIVAGRSAALVGRGPYVLGGVQTPGHYAGRSPTLGRALGAAHVEKSQQWAYVISGWQSATVVQRYALRAGHLAAAASARPLEPDDIVVVGSATVPRAITEALALLIPIGGEPRS